MHYMSKVYWNYIRKNKDKIFWAEKLFKSPVRAVKFAIMDFKVKNDNVTKWQ